MSDYINPTDGLIYCGKCHTPKQCRITAFGKETVQYCICRCEQKRLAEEKARREERKRQPNNAAIRRHTKIKNVDLSLKMDNGEQGQIKGTISLKDR